MDQSVVVGRPSQARARDGSRSQWAAAVRHFARNRMAVVGLLMLLVLVLLALFAGVAAPYDPVKIALPEALQPPSLAHLFGTDSFGRDVLSRMIYGGRVSLFVGLTAVGAALVVGVPLGLVAGFRGGRLDNLVMRLMDAILSFPDLLLAIAILGTLGAGMNDVILALALVYTPVFARLVRSAVLSTKEEDYILAAKCVGVSEPRIIAIHILPNILAPLVVQATATFSFVIIAEATLSFLGLGVQPPTPSWGQDVNEGYRYIQEAWWTVIGPALAISLSVLSVNFFGDGLRDALDPHLRTLK